jgi:Domain of unknown function (DUF5615)
LTNVHGDIVDGLRRRQPALDLVHVHDIGPSHTPDPLILEWAAQQGRVVVSVDKRTLAVDAWDRVARGLPMPGVAILRILLTIGTAVSELELFALASEPEDVRDQVNQATNSAKPRVFSDKVGKLRAQCSAGIIRSPLDLGAGKALKEAPASNPRHAV